MQVDQAIMVGVGLIIALSLIALGNKFTVSLSTRDKSATTQEQFGLMLRECWRKEPVQDCFVVDLNTTIPRFDPGVPVEWPADEVNGSVKVSREKSFVRVRIF